MINIDWLNFTPYHSLIGGICIGLAAVIIMLVNGRIMGISGVLSDLMFDRDTNNLIWRVVFIIGVLIGPLIYMMILGSFKSTMVASTTLLIEAGLLVGLGTAIGNGCTSGHGICGISRFSVRSIIATSTFVLSGMITVYLIGGKS